MPSEQDKKKVRAGAGKGRAEANIYVPRSQLEKEHE
jgi:hypothetical protein